MLKMEMNVSYLREVIKDLPDDMPVFVGCYGYTNYDFRARKPNDGTDTYVKVHDGKLFITDEYAVRDENEHIF